MAEVKEYQIDVKTVAQKLDTFALSVGMERAIESYRAGRLKVPTKGEEPRFTVLELLDTVITHAQRYSESGDIVTSTIATLIVDDDRAISNLTGLEHRFLMDAAITFAISEKTKELEYDDRLNYYFPERDDYPALDSGETKIIKRKISQLKNYKNMLRATTPTVNKERAS